jgi:hypothetical protein
MECSVTADRRASIRHPTVNNASCLEWWDGTTLYRSKSRLLDISDSGASLVTDSLPPSDRSIWLRLEQPVRTHWVTATVVWYGADGNVGVSFGQTCPFFFAAATLGIDFGGLLDAVREDDGI